MFIAPQVTLKSSTPANNGSVRIKVEPEFEYIEEEYYEDESDKEDYWGMPVKKKKRAHKEKTSRKRKKVKTEEGDEGEENE